MSAPVHRVRKAVLPVAGLGTRMLPAAKTVPKEMLTVVDRPLIHWVMAEARAAGIEHFVLVTGRNKTAMEDYFDRMPELEDSLEAKGKDAILEQMMADLPGEGELSYVRQMAPLGLGHAVWCARKVIGDEPFAVLLPDMIMDAEPGATAQAIAAYEKTGGSNIVVVEPCPQGEAHKYGVVALGGRAPEERLRPMTGMVESATFREARMRAVAEAGFSTATDLADWLVREAGLPFREAHHVTGRAVKLAEERGLGLDALPLADLKAIDDRIDERVYGVLSVDASVASRTSFGGTAPANVRAAIRAARGE